MSYTKFMSIFIGAFLAIVLSLAQAADMLIDATTSASTSSGVEVTGGAENVTGFPPTITFYMFAVDASGNAQNMTTPAEYADIQVMPDDYEDNGGGWMDIYIDGVQQRLSQTNNAVTVYGPGTYRVDKDSTTDTVGISYSKRDSR